jgi:hypothetical protein
VGKTTYRVRNWREYNQALKDRFSLTIYIDKGLDKQWKPDPTGKRGRPYEYSDYVIQCCLTIRSLFHLPLRGVEGFMSSIKKMTKMPVPDYTVMSRRAHKLQADLGKIKKGEPVHLVIDSSGLKIFGEGEWKVRAHGVGKRRTWRKIHIGIDEATGRVLVAELTKADKADCDVLPKMLKKVKTPVSKVGADGAYDKKKDYKAIAKIKAQAIIPPRCDAVANTKGKPSARDENIKRINKIGLKRWKKENGYHRRSLVETAFSRFKHIFGGDLRSRKFKNQEAEAMMKLSLMNKMTDLGMPVSVPVK